MVPGLTTNGVVQSLYNTGNTLLAGGHRLGWATVGGEIHGFALANVTPAAATLDQTIYTPGPNGVDSAYCTALATYNGAVYAAGAFTVVGGQPAAGFARYDGAWAPAGGGLTLLANAMAVYQNELVVGGNIRAAGSQFTHTWARWFCPQACYANCDGSTAAPILNVNDFTCFLNKYAVGDSYANCDGSTVPPVLNINDFICFQTKYAQGCP